MKTVWETVPTWCEHFGICQLLGCENCENEEDMRALRVDENQKMIVDALRAVGASVWVIGRPVDLLVGFRGVTVLMEVKNPNSRYGKKGMNENQKQFMSDWFGGTLCSVDSVDSALRALKVIQ